MWSGFPGSFPQKNACLAYVIPMKSGAFVTAGARIHLYTYLDRLQDKTIYCDTDSVSFTQPASEPALVETGENLGKMTSELKPNEIISEVVCPGPAYITINSLTGDSKMVCKVRGITLIYLASQLVNFAKMKDMNLYMIENETNCTHAE